MNALKIKQLLRTLENFPFHVPGVIFFFLSHGHSEYPGLIPLSDSILYFLMVLAVSIILTLVLKKGLQSFGKAGIMTTTAIFIYLFFGAILDAFKNSGFLALLSRYSILVPLLMVLIVGLYFALKNSKGNCKKLTLYINTVLILIILVDMITIGLRLGEPSNDFKAKTSNTALSYRPCDDCLKPDIFFIVLDEYSGSHALKRYFNYDNYQFEEFLKRRGFFVASHPMSNYVSTSLSMASTFDMDYLSWVTAKENPQVEHYSKAQQTITNSNLMKFLASLNYEFDNYSIFRIGNQPSSFNTGLLHDNLELITFKTLLNRMEKDLIWHFHQKITPRSTWLANKFQSRFRDGNNKLLRLTADAVKTKSDQPKFVYTHLFMPHFPWLFDSTGKEVKRNLYNPNIPKKEKEKAYLQYLVYTNKLVSRLVQDIQEKTFNKAVIIVMSDHGYKEIFNHPISSPNNNFISLYLPSGKYDQFYHSMTNVNFFRCVLNSLYKQNLPLLKDSIIH